MLSELFNRSVEKEGGDKKYKEHQLIPAVNHFGCLLPRYTQSMWYIGKYMKAGAKVDYMGSTKTQTASMRAEGLLAILYIFMTMALVMVILSQQQVLSVQYGGKEKLSTELERLGSHISKLDSSNIRLEEVLAQGEKVMEDLEAELANPGTDMEKMKTEICQAEKKRKADELAAKEKERTETEANLKSEFDAWNQEIQNLKAQENGYRPICDYVTDDTRVKKLCGTEGEPLA